MVINELRINPWLLEELQATKEKIGSEKILELGSLQVREPTYLGTALYLAKELRLQGIFDEIQNTLAYDSLATPIPRRIVQYWDESSPPAEVLEICQSWQKFNPDYEHLLFSREQAIAFLKKYYDDKVLQAFANCDQPATEADFFRLAYLNKMGGFYADADDMCLQSFRFAASAMSRINRAARRLLLHWE